MPGTELTLIAPLRKPRPRSRCRPMTRSCGGSSAFYVANAGKLDEAIEWASWAVAHDSQKIPFAKGNLAWALYLAGRNEEALQGNQGRRGVLHGDARGHLCPAWAASTKRRPRSAEWLKTGLSFDPDRILLANPRADEAECISTTCARRECRSEPVHRRHSQPNPRSPPTASRRSPAPCPGSRREWRPARRPRRRRSGCRCRAQAQRPPCPSPATCGRSPRRG